MVTATRNDQISAAGHFARNTSLEVPLVAVEASAHNPRRTFDAEALGELAASIAEHGLLEPLVVRETAPLELALIDEAIVISLRNAQALYGGIAA